MIENKALEIKKEIIGICGEINEETHIRILRQEVQRINELIPHLYEAEQDNIDVHGCSHGGPCCEDPDCAECTDTMDMIKKMEV